MKKFGAVQLYLPRSEILWGRSAAPALVAPKIRWRGRAPTQTATRPCARPRRGGLAARGARAASRKDDVTVEKPNGCDSKGAVRVLFRK